MPTYGLSPEGRALRERMRRFIDEQVIPAEPALAREDADAAATMRRLKADAKAAGLWALGHPKEIGGGGLPMYDYLYINEVVGRCEPAMAALGTNTLQSALLLHKHGAPWMRRELLEPLVENGHGVSFAVTERSRELGIRAALGATPRRILRQVLRQGLALALAGIGLGMVGALAAGRLLRGLLYEVTATDPSILTAVVLLLAAVALAASLVPAWRATRIDPMQALRSE